MPYCAHLVLVELVLDELYVTGDLWLLVQRLLSTQQPRQHLLQRVLTPNTNHPSHLKVLVLVLARLLATNEPGKVPKASIVLL